MVRELAGGDTRGRIRKTMKPFCWRITYLWCYTYENCSLFFPDNTPVHRGYWINTSYTACSVSRILPTFWLKSQVLFPIQLWLISPGMNFLDVLDVLCCFLESINRIILISLHYVEECSKLLSCNFGIDWTSGSWVILKIYV